MMKLRDWYKFNLENESFKCNFGNIYVKVFREESYNKEDMILEQLMIPDDMVYLFGDYKLFLVGKYIEKDYCTIAVYICKAD